LDAWVRHYPHDLFPSFWIKFLNLASTKKCIAIELIEHEISKKDDGCHKWFKENNLNDFFWEISDEVQNEVTNILQNSNYQQLVEDRKGSYSADPFVIALAKVENLIVVTGEKASNNIDKPKIPDVCNDLEIEVSCQKTRVKI